MADVPSKRKFRHYSMKPGTSVEPVKDGTSFVENGAEHLADARHLLKKKKKYKKVGKWLQRLVWLWALFCVFFALIKLGPESGLLPAPYVELFGKFLDELQDKSKEFLLKPLEHLLAASAQLLGVGLGYADKYIFVAPSPDQLHVLASTLYFMCAPWQLLPGLKKNFAAFYHWTGRFYLVSSIALALSGLRLVTTDTIDVTSAILGVLSLWSFVTGLMAFITKTDTVSHKRWVVRNLLSGIAIFSVRNVGAYLLAGLHYLIKVLVGPNVIGQIQHDRAALLLGALVWGLFLAHLTFVELVINFSKRDEPRPTVYVSGSPRPRPLPVVETTLSSETARKGEGEVSTSEE